MSYTLKWIFQRLHEHEFLDPVCNSNMWPLVFAGAGFEDFRSIGQEGRHLFGLSKWLFLRNRFQKSEGKTHLINLASGELIFFISILVTTGRSRQNSWDFKTRESQSWCRIHETGNGSSNLFQMFSMRRSLRYMCLYCFF